MQEPCSRQQAAGSTRIEIQVKVGDIEASILAMLEADDDLGRRACRKRHHGRSHRHARPLHIEEGQSSLMSRRSTIPMTRGSRVAARTESQVHRAGQ